MITAAMGFSIEPAVEKFMEEGELKD